MKNRIGVPLFLLLLLGLSACQGSLNEAPVRLGTISGEVSGAEGPEAGVWVIAETDDLKTAYIKIVVTDDAGRFVLPEMPNASYDIWVRGYGLKDSEKTQAKPGDKQSSGNNQGNGGIACRAQHKPRFTTETLGQKARGQKSGSTGANAAELKIALCHDPSPIQEQRRATRLSTESAAITT